MDSHVPSRRSLLRVGGSLAGVGVAVAVAGCLGYAGPSGQSRSTVRFWLREASKRDAVDPIVYRELPDGERRIVREALETGDYTEPLGEESAALESLRDRIEARTDTEATGELEVYLRRGDAYYRVGFVAGDNVVAHPDP